MVRNLKQAGAIVIGRTNTPEFSFRATTANELHGRTFSPWNDWATAGGSSGGASAATMMGYGPIAHGNDIGGSLRFPSTACGACTVKPGLGRVPAYNPSATVERGMLAQIMSVQGVIAREIKDVRLALQGTGRLRRPRPLDGARALRGAAPLTRPSRWPSPRTPLSSTCIRQYHASTRHGTGCACRCWLPGDGSGAAPTA